MKTILIMRHAKSSWENAYLSDHDRPLKKRGKRDAPRMAQLLFEKDLIPDLIISSSAKRALSTAEIVAIECDYDIEIQVTRELYHADSSIFIELLQGVTDYYSRIMIVGHNPGMEELIEDLTGEWHRMPTAAIAQVELPINHWNELDDETTADLENVWTPKNLPSAR